MYFKILATYAMVVCFGFALDQSNALGQGDVSHGLVDAIEYETWHKFPTSSGVKLINTLFYESSANELFIFTSSQVQSSGYLLCFRNKDGSESIYPLKDFDSIKSDFADELGFFIYRLESESIAEDVRNRMADVLVKDSEIVSASKGDKVEVVSDIDQPLMPQYGYVTSCKRADMNYPTPYPVPLCKTSLLTTAPPFLVWIAKRTDKDRSADRPILGISIRPIPYSPGLHFLDKDAIRMLTTARYHTAEEFVNSDYKTANCLPTHCVFISNLVRQRDFRDAIFDFSVLPKKAQDIFYSVQVKHLEDNLTNIGFAGIIVQFKDALFLVLPKANVRYLGSESILHLALFQKSNALTLAELTDTSRLSDCITVGEVMALVPINRSLHERLSSIITLVDHDSSNEKLIGYRVDNSFIDKPCRCFWESRILPHFPISSPGEIPDNPNSFEASRFPLFIFSQGTDDKEYLAGILSKDAKNGSESLITSQTLRSSIEKYSKSR